MKSFLSILSIAVLLLVLFLGSCSKCESCYLIETIDGQKVEESVGTICGDKIQEKESQEKKCLSGPCYYECR